jgi:hypothetical protein
MNHKAFHDCHLRIYAFKEDIQFKLGKIEELLLVVSNDISEPNAHRTELMLLSKLKNMMNILSLHASSILNDLSDLKIADAAYLENARSKQVFEIIENVTDVVAPQTDMIFEQTINQITKDNAHLIKLAKDKALEREREHSHDSLMDHPFYQNLNRH